MVNSLFRFARVLRLILPFHLRDLRAQKKTKGPRAATRTAAPWRQGTETGSVHILTGTVSPVNSPRQLGEPSRSIMT